MSEENPIRSNKKVQRSLTRLRKCWKGSVFYSIVYPSKCGGYVTLYRPLLFYQRIHEIKEAIALFITK